MSKKEEELRDLIAMIERNSQIRQAQAILCMRCGEVYPAAEAGYMTLKGTHKGGKDGALDFGRPALGHPLSHRPPPHGVLEEKKSTSSQHKHMRGSK
ncbi:unnamed protein product [Dovyalis caffra]|uniref:Uncharacterized protein n=1 Tax=Dovyalis caffra TaxID=77055 RepID=A0AAV1RCD7_9ROSI|nr:unnamed protein product [Dovyalis caffra]